VPINYGGKQFDVVSPDKMTPGEVDAIERATGLTFQKIRRMGETCVCEHGMRDHTHKDDAGDVVEDDTSCTVCSCEKHEGDVPTRVNTALMWVSIKRGDMSVKFSDVSNQPMDVFISEDGADVPDPTVQPQPEASPA
jgi:hypothetical protein